MPTLVTEQGIVHYEAYGRGRPVILLHGWLGSWALWRDTIEELGKEFRTYALDFFGFGDSIDRTQSAGVDNYVDLVAQFMDKLGISKAPLIGHSMGGTVSLGVANRYPQKVVKVVVIGSPINGSSLNFLLKLSGYKQIANLVYTLPIIKDSVIWGLTHIGVNDSKSLYAMVREDASKVSSESFFQSIGTLRETDMSDKISNIQVPILGVYGRKDIIVNPNQSKLLLKCAPTAREAWFDGSGHFPMMDEPQRFYSTVIDFLKNDHATAP